MRLLQQIAALTLLLILIPILFVGYCVAILVIGSARIADIVMSYRRYY